MKLIITTIALAALASLSACSTLLPPRDITNQQIADLNQAQLHGVNTARAEMPQAQQEVVQASRALSGAQNNYLVAQKYAEWKRLQKEQAQSRQDLAQAHIAAIQAQVQAEKAKAVVQAHPEMAKKIDVNRYVREATEKRADMESQRNDVHSLGNRIAAAYTNFRAATEKYGALETKPATASSSQRSTPAAGNGGGNGTANEGNALKTVPLGGG